MVELVKNTAKIRFIPATYELVSFTDVGADWELNKWRVGRPPQDLYDVWVRGDQIDKLDVAGMWDSEYQFSDSLPDITGKGPTISPGSFDIQSVTVVTPLKVNSARNKVRKPDQQQAMGIGSNDVSTSHAIDYLSSLTSMHFRQPKLSGRVATVKTGAIDDAEVRVLRFLIFRSTVADCLAFSGSIVQLFHMAGSAKALLLYLHRSLQILFSAERPQTLEC